MIKFEAEVCEYLTIPSIPLKEWDGKSSFKSGVAVIVGYGNDKSYAVCTFDSETDKKPRILKVFSCEPFSRIESIFVVPDYMNTDVDTMDLDDESLKAAQRLADEGDAIIEENAMTEGKCVPENPYCFEEIHNTEEAVAWLKDYYQRNKIKGRVPTNEDTIKLRLLTIWNDEKSKGNK